MHRSVDDSHVTTCGLTRIVALLSRGVPKRVSRPVSQVGSVEESLVRNRCGNHCDFLSKNYVNFFTGGSW